MEMKNIRVLSVGVLLAVLTTTSVFAASATKRFDEQTQTCRTITLENAQAGYVSFRMVCKSCHNRDNNEDAPFLYNESKTQRGWNRVFSEMYPDCAEDGSWSALDHEDLLNLNDYLFVTAACSSNPHEVGSCFA